MTIKFVIGKAPKNYFEPKCNAQMDNTGCVSCTPDPYLQNGPFNKPVCFVEGERQHCKERYHQLKEGNAHMVHFTGDIPTANGTPVQIEVYQDEENVDPDAPLKNSFVVMVEGNASSFYIGDLSNVPAISSPTFGEDSMSNLSIGMVLYADLDLDGDQDLIVSRGDPYNDCYTMVFEKENDRKCYCDNTISLFFLYNQEIESDQAFAGMQEYVATGNTCTKDTEYSPRIEYYTPEPINSGCSARPASAPPVDGLIDSLIRAGEEFGEVMYEEFGR